VAHESPDRAPFAWYWEQRYHALQRILASGGWSVHDIINRPEIRRAVSEQWQLTATMEQDRNVGAYIRYLEYREHLAWQAPPPDGGRPVR